MWLACYAAVLIKKLVVRFRFPYSKQNMFVTSTESFLLRQTISTCLQAVKPVNIQYSKRSGDLDRPLGYLLLRYSPFKSVNIRLEALQIRVSPKQLRSYPSFGFCATRHRRTQREESQGPVVLSQAGIFQWPWARSCSHSKRWKPRLGSGEKAERALHSPGIWEVLHSAARHGLRENATPSRMPHALFHDAAPASRLHHPLTETQRSLNEHLSFVDIIRIYFHITTYSQ